ncbi:hypothetical protein CLOM_g16318 [Closterium sp. NIES-68]|nr:hypothetical protein CLOM_g16318 [Closterium sp. NIES-68]
MSGELEHMAAGTGKGEERKEVQRKKQARFSGNDDADDDDDDTKPRRAVLPEKKPKKVKGAPPSADVSAMDLDDLGAEPGAAGGGSAGAAALMDSADPRVAAQARAQQRKRGKNKWGDTAFGGVEDVVGAEEDFQGEEEEKEAIEPFNLQQEREEGYFDAEGNYVEYREDTEATDAWLATAEVDPTLAAKAAARAEAAAAAEQAGEGGMGHAEMAAIRRRIADALNPGETVIQEVYSDKMETFQREAEGYEAILRARQGLLGGGAGEESTGEKGGGEERGNGKGGGDGVDIYYYNKEVGYYYDATSGLFCSAANGTWYRFNEATGEYEAVEGDSKHADAPHAAGADAAGDAGGVRGEADKAGPGRAADEGKERCGFQLISSNLAAKSMTFEK